MSDKEFSIGEVEELVSRATPEEWRVEQGTFLVWGESSSADGVIEQLGLPVIQAHTAPRSWGRNVSPDESAANMELAAAAPSLGPPVDSSDERKRGAKEDARRLAKAHR